MSKESLVSVIVPIYNVENFIFKTIESILSQDYSNLEIILVDDGSTDHSSSIIDDFALQDSRIIVVHKKNEGVSSARNCGLTISKGKYVTFIDGDDWVDPNYVSYLVDTIEDFNTDIVMNVFNYSDSNGKSNNSRYIVNNEKAMELIYLGKIFVAVWNKIYRRDFLINNKIIFDNTIWFGEGMLFNIDCLQYTTRVAICEKNIYHQVKNPDSAMRKFNLESNYCGLKSLDIQKEHWKFQNKRILNAWEYHKFAFNSSILCGLIISGQDKLYREVYENCLYNLKHDYFKALKVKISLKYKIRYLLLAFFPNIIIKRIKKQTIGCKNV